MRKKNRFTSRFFLSVFLLLQVSLLSAIAQPHVEQPLTYTFLNTEDNELQNATGLEAFFEKLFLLKGGDIQKVNIVHIGDSHIQADYLSEVVRKKIQTDFGNAGRGLVVPMKVAGTNEPSNFRSTSASTWNVKRIVHPLKPYPVGIGGITLNTEQPGASFTVKMRDPLYDFSFNAITLFLQNDKNSFVVSVRDSTHNEIGRGADMNQDRMQIRLPGFYNEVGFHLLKEDESQHRATLYGISFENSRPGVLYHAIGVNGAKYEHYNLAEQFPLQTKYLEPDLFIISLGTNESVEFPNLKTNIADQIGKLVETLSKNNPQASFILVTPPDAFLKKVRPNPGIELVRSDIIKYSVENGHAFWDMYKVNGGKNSATLWRENGLLRPDGIHFTKDGYAYQGTLLYEAIMKSYNLYVAARHP